MITLIILVILLWYCVCLIMFDHGWSFCYDIVLSWSHLIICCVYLIMLDHFDHCVMILCVFDHVWSFLIMLIILLWYCVCLIMFDHVWSVFNILIIVLGYCVCLTMFDCFWIIFDVCLFLRISIILLWYCCYHVW